MEENLDPEFRPFMDLDLDQLSRIMEDTGEGKCIFTAVGLTKSVRKFPLQGIPSNRKQYFFFVVSY